MSCISLVSKKSLLEQLSVQYEVDNCYMGYIMMHIQGFIGKIACFNCKNMDFPHSQWSNTHEMSAMVLIYCPRISIWHARCHKNPLGTYWSPLGRDSPHLRNWLYWKTAVVQFFAFYDFGHPKWPPNGKIWTRVVIGHMSGYVWRWFRPLRSAA